jgi:hypothetical protein
MTVKNKVSRLLASVFLLTTPLVVNATLMNIDIYNDGDLVTSSGTYYDGSIMRANLVCNDCSVLNYDGTSYSFGTTKGELFEGASAPPPGNSPSQETDWLNSVLGTSYPDATDANKTDPASDGTWYYSSAEYLILKVGDLPNYTIIRNDSSGTFDFKWAGDDGQGAGLSHFTEVGGVERVPEPGTLALLGLGLVSVFGLRRRQSSI